MMYNNHTMCDLKKYADIYRDFDSLNMDDYLQLITKSKSKDEKDFYLFLSNYFVQKKQQEFISEGKF
ncbi:MAG: hypothetical protein MJ060_04205 [Clostridia bacterium]|nr:hypothetical protein [Clostridia bacterium]